MQHRSLLLILGSVAALGAAALAIGAAEFATSATSAPSAAIESAKPAALRFESGDWLDELVHDRKVSFVRTAVAPADPADDQVLGVVAPLGRLVGGELRAVDEVLDRLVHNRRERLRAHRETMRSEVSADLVTEAQLVAQQVEAECALQALRRGSYYVQQQDAPLYRSVPNANMLMTGCRIDGVPANIVIVLRHDDFPDVRLAKEHWTEATRYHLATVAEAFNKLPWAERVRLLAARDAARAAAAPTQVDRDFLEAQFPDGLRIDQGLKLLIAAK